MYAMARVADCAHFGVVALSMRASSHFGFMGPFIAGPPRIEWRSRCSNSARAAKGFARRHVLHDFEPRRHAVGGTRGSSEWRAHTSEQHPHAAPERPLRAASVE